MFRSFFEKRNGGGAGKKPVFISLNFTGWIILIYYKITEIYRVKNEFNLTYEFREMDTGFYKIVVRVHKILFRNRSYRDGIYSCLCA